MQLRQRTVILARVALGDPFHAVQTVKHLNLAPLWQKGKRRYDSVIAFSPFLRAPPRHGAGWVHHDDLREQA